jgi:hypothetical protein
MTLAKKGRISSAQFYIDLNIWDTTAVEMNRYQMSRIA